VPYAEGITETPYAEGITATLTHAAARVGIIYHCHSIPHVIMTECSAAWLLWISNRQDHSIPPDADQPVHTAVAPSWDNPVVKVLLAPGNQTVYTMLQHIVPHGFPCKVELQLESVGDNGADTENKMIGEPEQTGTTETPFFYYSLRHRRWLGSQFRFSRCTGRKGV
jgi:hypothetical protein